MTNYENAPFFYLEFTDDGVLQFVNQELCDNLQYTAPQLIGKPIDVLLPVASRIFYNTHLLPLLTLQGSANEIFIFLQDITGAQIPLLVNGRRNQTTNVNSIAGIIVLNRKKFEEELIKTNQQLEKTISENAHLKEAQQQLEINSRHLDSTVYKLEAQKNDMLQFDKILTHDLQEPLRKLFFYGDILSEQLPSANNEIFKTWDKIVQAYQKLNWVLENLQNYVWMSDHALKRETIFLKDVMSALETWLNASFTGHTIHLKVGELSNIQADADLLMRLLHGIAEDFIRVDALSEEHFLVVKNFVFKRNVYRGLEGRYDYQDYEVITIELEENGVDFSGNRKNSKLTEHSISFSSPLRLALYRRIMDLHDGFMESKMDQPNSARITLFFPKQA